MKSSAFTATSVDRFKKNLRSVSVWKFRLNPLWTTSFSLSLFVKSNGHSGKVLMWSFVSPATQIERRLSARHGCHVPTWRGLRAAATAWTLSGCADTEHFLSFFSHKDKEDSVEDAHLEIAQVLQKQNAYALAMFSAILAVLLFCESRLCLENCRPLAANHRGSSEILQDGRSKVTTLIKSSILEPFFLDFILILASLLTTKLYRVP